MTSKHKPTIPALLALLALVTGGMVWATAEDAAAILKKVDGYSELAPAFRLEVRISDYEAGVLKEEMTLSGYFSGDDKSVLLCRSGKDKGMKILMKGDDMWVNLPGSKRGLRIAPVQRLLGQASNGDVAKIAFSRDYAGTIVLQNDSQIQLELKARSPGATYQRALLTVDARTLRPEKADFFLLSGKHFKTAYYLEFKTVEGHASIAKVKIEDKLNPALYTIIANGDYRRTTVPDKYFNVMYLPSLEVD
jgi:hypothetical protein